MRDRGIELLHVVGEGPDGQWAVFSLPDGDGTRMVSVVVPRSLWQVATRQDPFSSEIAIMERVGRDAISRRLAAGALNGPVYVHAGDSDVYAPPDPDWDRRLRVCGRCGDTVPAGEVLEGLANALPPDSRGHIEVKVLCPACQVQTAHTLTAWGVER